MKNNAFWIYRKNVTKELLECLDVLGYKQNQKYFTETDFNDTILFTTFLDEERKYFTFCRFKSAECNYDPYSSWLLNRDYIETSDELIKILKEIENGK